jgi:protein disulfide-isomerase A1
MNYVAIFALACLFICGIHCDGDVLVLDHLNFDQTITENPVILVEFYAPWCGHCKHLEPEYQKAATMLKEKEVPVKLAKVDANAEENAELRTRFQIQGFPTIKLFRDGAISDYQGERNADAIASFMKKQSQPPSTPLTSVDHATAFKDSDKVVVIGFFDNKDSAEYNTFTQVSKQLRDAYTFAEVVGDAAINKALGVEKTPTVVLFKKFDEGRNGLESFDNLAAFIQTHSVPLIDEIGPHNFKLYVESGLPLAYLFVDLTQEGQKDENLAHVHALATETKGKLNWVIIDWSKYAKHSERLGLSGKVVPSLAIEHVTEGFHYVFDETAPISKEGVTNWVRDFLDGKIQPTIKSEEVPASNDGPVKIVVANNFNDIVNDATKDVLLEFYAPWCGHCKKLAPIYDELGTALKTSNPNVVIAKVDATANDINPKFAVKGFPTIKFFPANNKAQPIDYEGDRSLSDMNTFVQTHTTFGSATGKDEL